MSQENINTGEEYKAPLEENVVSKELVSEVIPFDKTIETIEIKSESVEKQFDDVGGIEGITNTLNEMSPEDKRVLQEKIITLQASIEKRKKLNEYGDDYIDDMWDITKSGLALNFNRSEFNHYFLEKQLDMFLSFLLGASLLPTVGPAKGISYIGRQIQDGIEKRKLKNLEKKMAQ
jgi:hypothetical protein